MIALKKYADVSAPGRQKSKIRLLHSSSKSISRLNCMPLQDLMVVNYPWWKRAIDLFGASVSLILFSPLMLATAIAIKMTSKGPILYKQQRAGLCGKPFGMLKFRSMCENADKLKATLRQYNERTGPAFKMKNDPRVTPIGRMIRKWSIDELPQLINVIIGDMSLVGPRPPTLDEIIKYDGWHNCRLEVKPGITCIWQITSRNDSSFENWVRLDIKYKNQSGLIKDIFILLQTVYAVLVKKGV